MEFDLQVLLMLLGQKDYEIAMLNKQIIEKEQQLKDLTKDREPRIKESGIE